MPVKPEVISEFFGIDPEKFENDEVFKEAAAKEWTKVSEAVNSPALQSAITGRMNAAIIAEMKKVWKENELPTEGIKWDEAKPVDMVPLLAGSLGKKFSERETKLTESLKGKGSEEAKKEFDRQIAELSKKSTDFEALTGTLRGEIEARDKAEREREAHAKENGAWDRQKQTGLKDVKFKNDLEKTGFDAVAHQRYKVMFDDKGEEYWTGTDGKRIPDGTRHQAFKDGAQLLKELAVELKVGDVNPRGGEKVGPRPASQRSIDDGVVKPIRQRIIASPGRVLTDAPPT